MLHTCQILSFPQTTIINLHFVFWCYIFSFSKNNFFLISILGWRISSVYFWARTLCKSYSSRKYLKFEFRCGPTIRGSYQLFRSFKNSGKYITDLGSLIGNTQCGNFRNFLPLRIYVKSISMVLEVQKVPYFAVLEPLNIRFGKKLAL